MWRVSGGNLPTLTIKVGRVRFSLRHKREDEIQPNQGPKWVT